MEGHGQPPGRHRLAFGAVCFFAAQNLLRDQHVQNPVAGGFGLLREAVGPATGWVLGQGDEQGAFRPGQLSWCFAEIEPRGGRNAVDVAAKGGRDEVKVEDFMLVEAALKLPRAQDLQHFGLKRAVRAWLQQACGLHAQGRSAGDDAPGESRGHHRPREAPVVGPAVGVEPSILEGEQGAQISRVHVCHTSGQAPVPGR